MNQNRIHKLISYVLIAGYINLIAITAFHFHASGSTGEKEFISGGDKKVNLIDPYGSGDSGCGLTYFASLLYINENPSAGLLHYQSEKNTALTYFTEHTLYFFNNSHSLRAPPTLS